MLSPQASAALLQTFLSESEGGRAVLVADPPFGGLVKPLANSFSLISLVWRSQNPGQLPLVSVQAGVSSWSPATFILQQGQGQGRPVLAGDANTRVFLRAGHMTPEMPMIWIFPYFFEPRILECLPSLTMLDYQVASSCPL